MQASGKKWAALLSRVIVIMAVVTTGGISAIRNASAETVEVGRHKKRYQIELKLPAGAYIDNEGLDRIIRAMNFGGNFRLIQDEYSNCRDLIDERHQNNIKNGYHKASRRSVTQKECSITLSNSGGQMMTSYYVWLDICKCYSALHFLYQQQDEKRVTKLFAPIVASLRGAKPKTRPNLKEVTTADWVEAVAILKQRGFPAAVSFKLYRGSPIRWREGTIDTSKNIDQLIAEKYGTTIPALENGMVGAGDFYYDLETGAYLAGMSPQEMAKSISSCYMKPKYWKACGLNYHQEGGCRMSKYMQAACRSYLDNPDLGATIGDNCFWEPRGDLPMAPAKDSFEKTVTLPKQAKAKSNDKAKTKKKKSAATKLDRPLCEDDLKWLESVGVKVSR